MHTMQLDGKKTKQGKTNFGYFAVMRTVSEKLPFWIIGKYLKTNAFKNVNLNSLNYNMTFENSDEGGESTQKLPEFDQRVCVIAMPMGCPKMFLTHPEENVFATVVD
ncbi:hypothetical protein Tco_0969262 [Tanacetum coccineum]